MVVVVVVVVVVAAACCLLPATMTRYIVLYVHKCITTKSYLL